MDVKKYITPPSTHTTHTHQYSAVLFGHPPMSCDDLTSNENCHSYAANSSLRLVFCFAMGKVVKPTNTWAKLIKDIFRLSNRTNCLATKVDNKRKVTKKNNRNDI